MLRKYISFSFFQGVTVKVKRSVILNMNRTMMIPFRLNNKQISDCNFTLLERKMNHLWEICSIGYAEQKRKI